MDVPGNEPCSSAPACGKKNDSCKKNDTPAKDAKDPNKCCDMGICNPFGACCSYLPTYKYTLDLTCIAPGLQKLKLTNENGLSFYIQEVWKPPKSLAVLS